VRAAGIFAITVVCMTGQNWDTEVKRDNRKTVTILVEVKSVAERQAFLDLYRERDLAARRTLATAFMNGFPDSWLLPQVLEAAAKASFDLGDYPTGFYYARRSLLIYPENPLLLVPVAVAHVRRGEREAAVASARLALEHLDRFVRPVHVTAKDWRAPPVTETTARRRGRYIQLRDCPIPSLPRPDTRRANRLVRGCATDL
jgi:hypothetical protein